MTNAIDKPISITFVVKHGATREAMVHLHHKKTLEIKRIHCEAAIAHLEELKPTITCKTYWESINSWKADELGELDLQRGIRQLPNRDLAINRAEEAYTAIVNRVQARKAREKADKESKEMEKNKLDEEMLKNGPADALRELISVGVRAELKQNTSENNPDVKMQPVDEDEPIENFSSPDDVNTVAEKAVEGLVMAKKTEEVSIDHGFESHPGHLDDKTREFPGVRPGTQ